MVTHDPNAASYADRVIFLADGRIVDELPTRPPTTVLDKLKSLDVATPPTREAAEPDAARDTKSLLARKLRLILSGLAVVLASCSSSGVVRAHRHARAAPSTTLFANIYTYTDVQVSAKPKTAARSTANSAATPCPAADVARSRRCPGCAEATGAGVRRRRPGHRQERQGRDLGRAAQFGGNWTGEDDADQAARRAAAPQADDEVVINAALAKTGEFKPSATRSTSSTRRSRKQDVQGRRHLRLHRRPGLDGRRARRCSFTEPVAQQADARRDRRLQPSSTSRRAAGVSETSCATTQGRARREYVVQTGEELPKASSAAVSRTAEVLQLLPARLRRGRAARRHVPDPQHVLDHRGAAHAGAGAAAGDGREPAADHPLGAAGGAAHRPDRLAARASWPASGSARSGARAFGASAGGAGLGRARACRRRGDRARSRSASWSP